MRYASIGLEVALALGLTASAALAAGQGGQNQAGQNQANAGPAAQTQDKKVQHGQGLFPPNEPMPQYSTGANGVGTSLVAPGRESPNAGATGVNGSGGTSFGWPAHNYGYGTPAKQP